MKCKCNAKTPKGIMYHPALKSVYERCGTKGELVKVGYRCPKCHKFYELNKNS